MKTSKLTSKLIQALIIGGLISVASGASVAAGLGRLTVQSSLGQPLQAEIELLSVQKDEIDSLAARIASQEAFREAQIGYTPILASVRFSVEKRANGQPYLRLSTTQPVNEPFVDMLVELSSASGRLVREFPLLLDPPEFAATKPAPPATAATPPEIRAPQVADTGAAPGNSQAGAAAQPSAAATGTAGDYTVKTGDTLYRIAGATNPGVDLDQMVVALFRENSQAFMGNNMNRLKSGAILRVPSAEQASSVAPRQARQDIRAQTADWNAYRGKLAAQVAARPAPVGSAKQSASGAITQAAVEQPAAAAAPPTDVLSISKGAESKGDGKAAQAAKANALREEAIAQENRAREEKERVAQLEKNVQSMRQLLTLKDEGLAAKQKQAEAAKRAPAPVAAPTPAAPPVPAATTVAPAATPGEEKPAPAAEMKLAEAKPKASPQGAPLAAPEPEPTFMEQLLDNPLLPIAGATAVLLAGFLGYSTYRRRHNTAPMTAGTTSSLVTDLKSGTMPGAKTSGVVDTGNSSFLTDFEKTGPGIIDVEEVDPVAEAEVYIAYGRDSQAEEILREAMAKDTSRHEIPLKLLEIYSTRQSAASFETVAKDLHRSIGSNHPVWQRVADMGRKLDPTNALYGGVAAVAVAAAEPSQSSLGKEAIKAEGPSSEEMRSLGNDIDFDLGQSSKASAHTPAAPAWNMSSPAPTAERNPAADGNMLDFDIGDNVVEPPNARPEPPAAEQTLLVRPRFTSQFNDDDLDLSEFDAGEKAPTVTPRDFTAQHEAEAPLPELAAEDEPIVPAAMNTAATRPTAMDFGSLNLDLSPLQPVADAAAGEEISSEWHSVATKLDLARAYLEIGDKDGAREILQEVIQEGDGEQKREAETLTAGIA